MTEDGMLEHSDFYIGMVFYTDNDCGWLCTDIGTRTVIAIKNDGANVCKKPPYDVVEYCFDEYDIDGCTLTAEEWG